MTLVPRPIVASGDVSCIYTIVMVRIPLLRMFEPLAECNHAYHVLLDRQWLPRLMDQHRPQLVMFQAGVDALKGDRWAR